MTKGIRVEGLRLMGLIWSKRRRWKAITLACAAGLARFSSPWRPSPIVHVRACARARVSVCLCVCVRACMSLGKDCGRLAGCFNRKRSIRHRNRGICYRDDRPTIFASPFLSDELANRRDVVCFPDGNRSAVCTVEKLLRLVFFSADGFSL